MFGERIQKLRKMKRESQETFAKSIGVTRQTLAKWEKNKTVPNLLEAKRLAESFDMTLDELVAFEDKTAETVELGPDTYYVFGKAKMDSQGKIKIPLNARKVFQLKGDSELFILGDLERGIELIPADALWTTKFLQTVKESEEGKKK